MSDADIAAALLADKAVLDADDIPNANQSIACFSCGEAMTGVHCAACGQKNDDYRRSIFQLIFELIGSFTAIESRIWRTWGALIFKPGKVAREFADGARVKWSTPIRVFLAVSIILFGFLSLTKTQLISVDMNVTPKAGITKPHAELTNKDLKINTAVRFFQSQSQIDEQNKTRNFDLIEQWMSGGTGFYLTDTGGGFDINTDGDGADEASADEESADEDSAAAQPAPKIIKEEKVRAELRAQLDALNNVLSENMTEENRAEMQALTDQLGARIESGQKLNLNAAFVDVVRNPSVVNGLIYKWLPRIMFLMMPITMFIGVLFIRGRKKCFALMTTSSMLLISTPWRSSLVFLGIILMKILPGDLVARALFVAMLIYLPLSLKRMFGRGWFKTIWASYGVGVIYAFTLTYHHERCCYLAGIEIGGRGCLGRFPLQQHYPSPSLRSTSPSRRGKETAFPVVIERSAQP